MDYFDKEINDEESYSEGDSQIIENNNFDDTESNLESPTKKDKNKYSELRSSKNQKSINSKLLRSKDKKKSYEPEEEDEEEDSRKHEIQEKIFKVFLNYSKFNIQEENFILSHQYFMKIMKDCGLLREKYEKPTEDTLTAEQIDITLKKVCPKSSSLNSFQFTNFFVTLSQRLYPNNFNKDPRGTLAEVVNQFLNPIIEEINNDDKGKFLYNKVEQSINITAEEKIDSKTKKIMKSIFPGLLNAYRLYFPQEYNYKGIPKEKLIKESLKSLTDFNIDFDLCTPFLTREKLAIYYNCIYLKPEKNLVYPSKKKTTDEEIYLGEGEEGKIFTFDKFAFYLLCLANDVIPDDKFPKQWQKVSRLIKYLSDSNGEETMIKKFGAKITDDKGIYLDDQVIKELIKEDEEAKRLQNEQESPDSVLSDVEKETVLKIFLSQANKDKMTQGKLTITPFFNLLRELGIFDIQKENGELVSRKDAEMAMTQVSRKKNVPLPKKISVGGGASYRNYNCLEKNINKVISKLDFEMFLKSLQELSLRIYPSLKRNEAFEKLMHEQIKIGEYQLTSDNDEILDSLREIVQKEDTDSDFIIILNEFKPIFKEIYDNYCDIHKSTMSWQNFLIFCKDFNIIPDSLTLNESNAIFNGLSKRYTEERNLNDTGVIDFTKFYYAIGIAALRIQNDEQDENNLISLLLSMQPSRGIQRPRDTGKGIFISYQNKFTNKLNELKKVYPSYFNNGEPDDIKTTSFNDIFSL